MGVFLSDMSLVPIQTYTTDRVKLRKAIDEAATRATSVFDRDAIKESEARWSISPPGTFIQASRSSPAPSRLGGRPKRARVRGISGGRAALGRRPAVPDWRLIAPRLAWERLAREQQGYASLNALRAVIEGLSVLPGRKSVVFFAEGLALPEAVMPQFDSVVATANRANVSVYTIDAAGLRVHSKDAETGREVRAIGAQSMIVNPDGSTGGSLGALERIEDVLRKDPRTSLTLLADRTGGFLIENTNDLASRVPARSTPIAVSTTCSPTRRRSSTFPASGGASRCACPRARSRSAAAPAIPAVRTLSAIPLLAYEGPALAALDRTPPPADLPLRLGAFVFPDVKGGSRAALMVAASGPTLTFAETPDGFRTDFLLMARVKDDTGEVVRKGSQPYRLTGPAADRERTQKGEILFYRQPELPPGRYTVEGVVHDALGPRAGVVRMPLEVPAQTGLRVSSLVIVSRTERLMSGELDPDNPLQVRDRLIYPNLGEPLQRRRTDTVGLLRDDCPVRRRARRGAASHPAGRPRRRRTARAHRQGRCQRTHPASQPDARRRAGRRRLPVPPRRQTGRRACRARSALPPRASASVQA